MRVNIFGMGYVGCVSAACLASNGNHVTGVDVDETKVNAINEGRSPVIEAGLGEMIRNAVSRGNLRATTMDIEPADVSLVCVGTPSNDNGSIGIHQVIRVSEQIGNHLRRLDPYHVVSIRSTVLPGTVLQTVIPLLEERSGKKAGPDFGVCVNPEFMRTGTSINDFYNPSFTLIGELDTRSGSRVQELYKDLRAPVIRTSVSVAEMVKYACNAFHGLKVSFANEIGNVSKRLGIDSHEVMDIFCQDNVLNISPYYLRPGFAFGGSCLPKDIRALLYKATQLDLDCPVLNSILRSNEKQVELAFDLIKKTGRKNIGILGLSFKAGTDDLRESPLVTLIEKLLGKGYDIKIYDKNVSLARIIGSNKGYIEGTIPHISTLLRTSVQEVIDGSDVVVVGSKSDEFKQTLSAMSSDKIVLDLVRIVPNPDTSNDSYEGICW